MQGWFAEFLLHLQDPWAMLGFGGQALFFSRWVVQWVAAERKKESYVPLSFWYISLAGGLMVLIYAIKVHNPVFMLGQIIGCANYSRNIMLIRAKEAAQ